MAFPELLESNKYLIFKSHYLYSRFLMDAIDKCSK